MFPCLWYSHNHSVKLFSKKGRDKEWLRNFKPNGFEAINGFVEKLQYKEIWVDRDKVDSYKVHFFLCTLCFLYSIMGMSQQNTFLDLYGVNASQKEKPSCISGAG